MPDRYLYPHDMVIASRPHHTIAGCPSGRIPHVQDVFPSPGADTAV